MALAVDALPQIARGQLPPIPVLPPLPLPPSTWPLPHEAGGGEPGATAPSQRSQPAPQSSARNQPLAASPETEAQQRALLHSEYHEVWYGWETLIGDAATVSTLLVGANFHGSTRPYFTMASIGLYTVIAPTVHFARGELLHGVIDAALRVTLPLVAFGLGYAIAAPGGYDRAMRTAEIWSLGAGTSASAFDAAVLAWHRWRSPASEVPFVGLSTPF